MMPGSMMTRQALVVFLLAVGASSMLAAVLFAMLILREPPISGSPIARAGEWVTNPDGSRVCRLTRDLTVGMTPSLTMCSDWQTEKPGYAQIVPWLRVNRMGSQINVEGKWRP